MALVQDGNIVMVHAAFGIVWVVSPIGEPLFRINTWASLRVTNVAFEIGASSNDADPFR